MATLDNGGAGWEIACLISTREIPVIPKIVPNTNTLAFLKKIEFLRLDEL